MTQLGCSCRADCCTPALSGVTVCLLAIGSLEGVQWQCCVSVIAQHELHMTESSAQFTSIKSPCFHDWPLACITLPRRTDIPTTIIASNNCRHNMRPSFSISAQWCVGTFSKWHTAIPLLSPMPAAPGWRSNIFDLVISNKKLNCRRETARHFVSLTILLSHSRSSMSFEMTMLSRTCVCPY